MKNQKKVFLKKYKTKLSNSITTDKINNKSTINEKSNSQYAVNRSKTSLINNVLKMRLKDISGKEFLICFIVVTILISWINTLIISSSSKLVVFFLFSVIVLLFIPFVYITYQRWSLLKLGNKLFVFYCLLSILMSVYAKPDNYNWETEFLKEDYSIFKEINTVLSPFYKFFVFIMNLTLVFKNAKVKTKLSKSITRD